MGNYTVYIHIFPNNKRYIGCTKLKLSDRWRNGKGYKNNKEFLEAVNNFGWDNVKHEIVAENLEYESACILESELIKKYNTTNLEYGFNKSNYKGTGGVPVFKGKRHTEETKNKISLSNKNKRLSDEHKNKISIIKKQQTQGKDNPFFGKRHSESSKEKIRNLKSIEVCQYDINNNFIRKWNSAKMAGNELHIDPSTITKCCKGKVKSIGGFRWKYANKLRW